MRYSVLILLFISSLSSFSQTKSYQNVSNEDFKKLARQPNTVILDVRTPAEFASGRISGAVLIDVSNSDFEKKISSLDKSKTYLVYCRSGARSARASSVMVQKGFDKVFNLTNGIMYWDGSVEK